MKQKALLLTALVALNSSFIQSQMTVDSQNDPNIQFEGSQMINQQPNLPQKQLNLRQLNTLITAQQQFQLQIPQLNLQLLNIIPCIFISKKSKNFILNGGFEQNQCKSNWCIWNQSSILPSSVPGWIPSPEIEVGLSEVYGITPACSWVAELDPNANTCIEQRINLKNGRYILEFDYAGRANVMPDSNKFSVLLNGKIIKSYSPKDNAMIREKIQFKIDNCACSTMSTLSFCGNGKSDALGALIDNVDLYTFECAL